MTEMFAVKREEKRYLPDPRCKAAAWTPDYTRSYQEFMRNLEAFWDRIVRELPWFEPWGQMKEWNYPYAKLNIAHNCLDRHAAGDQKDKPVTVWHSEGGEERRLTYDGLYRGVDAGLATLLVGFFAIFNGAGRPAFGGLADRISPQKTAMLTFGLIAAASVLIWLAPGVPAYVVSFAILWGCLGGWLAIAPAATASYFGTCDYPRCYGVVFLAYGAGAIAGPQLAGFVRTATGTYLGVFPLVAVLAAVGFAVAWLLMRPPAAVPASAPVPVAAVEE